MKQGKEKEGGLFQMLTDNALFMSGNIWGYLVNPWSSVMKVEALIFCIMRRLQSALPPIFQEN